MNSETTKKFDRNCQKLAPDSRKRIRKAMKLLLTDPRHSSLRLKKMEEWETLWEAGASMDLRITFHFENPDTIVFRNCAHHDPTLRNP